MPAVLTITLPIFLLIGLGCGLVASKLLVVMGGSIWRASDLQFYSPRAQPPRSGWGNSYRRMGRFPVPGVAAA